MYEAFFKLRGRPFLAPPETSRYFPATVIETARQTLCRLIERGEGIGLIVGPSGTGKTLLCQMLADEFNERFSVALLINGRLGTRQALLQAILYELGLPYRGLNEGELRLALLDNLEPKAEGNRGLLLLVDEAHTLPWRLLEEVRMLTNLVRDGQPRVRVVLAGIPLLEEHLANPKLTSFAQRLAARCYLEAFDSAETMEYIRAQVAAVGGDAAQIFQEDALRTIYRATDGVGRLINQICDHALILAGLGGHHRLTSEAIDEAWADLQQLPAPWIAPKQAAAEEIVEFGGLDEASDDPREAIPFRSPAERQLQVAEPEEQLEAIAEQLSSIDDTFHPAGSIGTQVDLDFPEFGDPFGEQFAEDEVVFERFSADADIFAGALRVSSLEGKQLGSLLESLDTAQPAAPKARLLPPAPDVEKAVASADNDVAAVRKESLSAIQRGQRRDQDLIVVDDEARIGPLWPRPRSGSRKLEYRQLFARLRRN